MIFVDTNVLIDVTAPNQAWREWSNNQLAMCARTQLLVVNPIVVVELAIGFPLLRDLAAWLADADISVLPLDEEIAFLSGQSFASYRGRHRDRTAILSDFLIGGHSIALGATLLTRDAAIYRTYFPELTLITPENDHD